MKTSRFLTPRIGLAALMMAVATAAFAQQGFGGPPQGGPGGGPGMRGPGGHMGGPERLDRLPSLARLARRPEVAEELNLTETQRTQIDAIADAMRPQGGPGREERGQDGPPRPEDRDKAEAAADAKVKAILSAGQTKRLNEIAIQTMGLSAAMVPDIQAKLGLSADQKAKLKALVPQRPEGGPGGPPPGGPDGDMGGPPDRQGGPGGPPQGGFQGGPGGGPEGRGGRGGPGGPGGARKKELETKIAAILTEGQRASLKAMGGKTLAMRGPQGPRGGD